MDLIKNTSIIIMGVLFFMSLNACSTGYQGPASDHFDGSKFFNKEPDHNFTDMVKWLWEMETVEWPEWIEDPKQPPPISRVDNGDLRITFINHATVLIQMDQLSILTDPVFSMKAGPFSWAGVKRVRAPGISLDNLPEIDYILISHDHYDHLDIPTLRQITARHQPTILVGLGTKEYLESKDIKNVIEMDWWDKHWIVHGEKAIIFVPARHNSGRWPLMGNRTLWGGFIIDSPNGQVYFAGDTAFGEFFYLISERFEKIRLSILPIGSYEKRWFMESQHMNPDDAVKAHKVIGSSQSVGIHYGTFAEHPEQAIDAHEKDLFEALKKYEIPSSVFWILSFGEGRDVVGIY